MFGIISNIQSQTNLEYELHFIFQICLLLCVM